MALPATGWYGGAAPAEEVGSSTQNIYVGSSQPSAFYAGSTQVQSIYLGSTLIWEI
jgi:hypothetical protein